LGAIRHGLFYNSQHTERVLVFKPTLACISGPIKYVPKKLKLPHSIYIICKFDGLNDDHYQLKNKIFLQKFDDLTENGNFLFFSVLNQRQHRQVICFLPLLKVFVFR